MKESAGRGEFSVDYSFDEEVETLLHRCKGINIPAIDMINKGFLSVIKVEPLRLTPDEFVHIVRRDVEEANARIVMIDSISGYRLAFRDPDINRHLHALCKYLANRGVTVFLVD